MDLFIIFVSFILLRFVLCCVTYTSDALAIKQLDRILYLRQLAFVFFLFLLPCYHKVTVIKSVCLESHSDKSFVFWNR